jgi:hypothetical protein
MVTDIVDILGFSLAREEINGDRRGLGPAEGATELMEETPHRGGDTQVQPHTVKCRAESCSSRHPPSDFKLP